jgi:hypothetical protein
MLSLACLRFRARFSPGLEIPHRGWCPTCDAYATALERAAAMSLPVPEALAAALRDIPARQTAIALPVARVAVPGPLADRLRAIPRQAGRVRPPAWIRSPRYAIAASTLLTVLVGALGGDPGKTSRALSETLSAGVTSVVRAADGLLSRLEGEHDESR